MHDLNAAMGYTLTEAGWGQECVDDDCGDIAGPRHSSYTLPLCCIAASFSRHLIRISISISITNYIFFGSSDSDNNIIDSFFSLQFTTARD